MMSRTAVRVLMALLCGAVWPGLPLAAQGLPTYTITARDGRLWPERLEVPAGVRIKLVLINEGRQPVEFENLGMRVEKVLAPGATSFVVLPVLRPGRYEFIDEFHMDTGRVWVVAR
ncbi:cupredoxin domain-containing protein [Tepidimonas taiwanensis]|uniref:cupredoxin domain-containing protein n=1 Tax=Tepidimonas taiwanensis TaxID=307486 RepID=UPI00068E5409|nr:cupredoxin domain-containing protein [Tepidimonas taiwanensis]